MAGGIPALALVDASLVACMMPKWPNRHYPRQQSSEIQDLFNYELRDSRTIRELPNTWSVKRHEFSG
jgi:hypothetical protein